MTLAMIDMPDIWPAEFGIAVANDRGLYRKVCNGRKPRAPMIDRIRRYIATERDAHGLPHCAPADADTGLIQRIRIISVANNN